MLIEPRSLISDRWLYIYLKTLFIFLNCLLQEFLLDLSVLCRGHIRDKLEWLFCLYDINEDGLITKTVLSEIVHSIYCLMSRKPYTERAKRGTSENMLTRCSR
ncbi:hypothetical protein CEXT_589611 [Caerostris extrusa]|uniref:EF-hand domain-containing protein n=1 Tax=Caerostris extrusa TaxID=172846 RepID=A0AAV4QLQ7_CAEEX|nr:hypothetical protein CEXT_589611 [Caerostris extrusa]